MNKIIDFFNGEYRSGRTIKEEYLILSIALSHVIYLVMFTIFNYWILVGVNVLSIISYMLCFLPRFRRSILYITIQITVEVSIHVMFAVLLIGWNYGFEQFIVLLIPALYYLKYTASQAKQRKIQAWIGALYCVAVFFVFKNITVFVEPLYHPTKFQGLLLSLFNGFMAYSMILFMMSIFFGAIIKSERHLKNKNERLRNIANIDPLTELFNRRGLDEFVRKSLDDALHCDVPFCVVMCDIDDFKKINDVHGHSCGDYVLQTIATTFKEHTRSHDCICRWGGEEMLILLADCKREKAIGVAEKLREKIEDLVIDYNETQIRFTMTFGTAEYESGKSFDQIVDIADSRLYDGKHSGKNTVV